MPKYCDIFLSFFKIGTFTIGGGYAMIPLMQRELVDRHRWLTDDEFADCVALSQAMPGVFAVNMATLTGQRLRGVRGALTAIVGNVAVPILAILLLATFFRSFRDNPYVQRIFVGLRPCVVALIAAPVFNLWKNEWSKRPKGINWSKGSKGSKGSNGSNGSMDNLLVLSSNFLVLSSYFLIPIASALLILLLGVNPILIVLAAALLGLLYGKLKTKK